MQSTATASSSHQPFFTDDVPAVFDAVAASRLLPQLVDLARLASGGGGGEDSETAARTAKLEIGKQVSVHWKHSLLAPPRADQCRRPRSFVRLWHVSNPKRMHYQQATCRSKINTG